MLEFDSIELQIRCCGTRRNKVTCVCPSATHRVLDAGAAISGRCTRRTSSLSSGIACSRTLALNSTDTSRCCSESLTGLLRLKLVRAHTDSQACGKALYILHAIMPWIIFLKQTRMLHGYMTCLDLCRKLDCHPTQAIDHGYGNGGKR